jgi:hypothetical protein
MLPLQVRLPGPSSVPFRYGVQTKHGCLSTSKHWLQKRSTNDGALVSIVTNRSARHCEKFNTALDKSFREGRRLLAARRGDKESVLLMELFSLSC